MIVFTSLPSGNISHTEIRQKIEVGFSYYISNEVSLSLNMVSVMCVPIINTKQCLKIPCHVLCVGMA